jgi:putative transposase
MYTGKVAKRPKIGFVQEESPGSSRKPSVEGAFEGAEYLLLTNFGLQGTPIFSSQEDYDRFEAYLYLLNSIDSPRASNYFLDDRRADLFSAVRGDPLVAIGAYSFTPRHFYIVATPCAPRGVARFMQKIQTAYTMYFNYKYQRSGRLFHAAYRAQTATSDAHLKYLLSYAHLAPSVIFNSLWEEASDVEMRKLAHKVVRYRYSSIGEYSERKFVITRPQLFPPYFLKAAHPDTLVAFRKQFSKANKKGHPSNTL